MQGADLHHVEQDPLGEVVAADATPAGLGDDGEQLVAAVARRLEREGEVGQGPPPGVPAVGLPVGPELVQQPQGSARLILRLPWAVAGDGVALARR